MDLGALTRAGYLRLLKKLGGGGYTQEEDTVRHTELDAVARIAEMVTEGLQTSFANLFVVSAVEALDKLERVRFLLQQSTLTTERRRARLIAFAQGAAKQVSSRLAHATAVYLDATTGTQIGVEAYDLSEQWASPLGAFLLALREPDADKQGIRDLQPVLSRGLPARGLALEVSSRDAVWGDPFEPAGISPDPENFVPPQTKARCPVIEALPGSVIRREDWIELQSMLAWKSRGFTIDQDRQGRTVFLAEYGIGAASSILLDGPTANASIDWQNRFIQAWGIVGAASIPDPTQATDSEHVWLPASKTGPAAGGYIHTLTTQTNATVATDIKLQVDASGNITLSNTGGSTKYVTLMVRCTPVYTPSSSADTQPWLSVGMGDEEMEELFLAQVISDDAPGEFAGVPAGAIRRVVCTGALNQQDLAGRPQGVVLDTSEDWRNRYVVVVATSQPNGSSAFPTPGTFTTLAIPGLATDAARLAPRLFYTGPGAAMGSPTANAYQQPISSLSATPDVWLFARDTDGALVCEMKDGLSLHDAASVIIAVVGTERDDGSSVVTAVPVHATKVHTLDVEQPQNCGLFAQGFQGNVPRWLLTDPAPRAIPTCPPLGLISEGPPPVRPVSWLVRERLGELSDPRYEVRQKIYGQRKRIVSIAVPSGGSTAIDDFNIPAEAFPAGVTDQMDWRDRLVWIEGRRSATDITVSDASPSNDNAGTPILAILYTGPATIAVGAPGIGVYRVLLDTNLLWLDFHFSRAASGEGLHSTMSITNTSGSTVYFNFTVECTGFLGFGDRRLPGQVV